MKSKEGKKKKGYRLVTLSFLNSVCLILLLVDRFRGFGHTLGLYAVSHNRGNLLSRQAEVTGDFGCGLRLFLLGDECYKVLQKLSVFELISGSFCLALLVLLVELVEALPSVGGHGFVKYSINYVCEKISLCVLLFCHYKNSFSVGRHPNFIQSISISLDCVYIIS